MAQHTNKPNAANKPAKQQATREGDEPQDIREAKPDHDRADSKDRGRDRNPGDMQRDENGRKATESRDLVDAADTDVRGTGFDESDSDLDDAAGDADFAGEDETNASGGSHSKNPNPRNR